MSENSSEDTSLEIQLTNKEKELEELAKCLKRSLERYNKYRASAFRAMQSLYPHMESSYTIFSLAENPMDDIISIMSSFQQTVLHVEEKLRIAVREAAELQSIRDSISSLDRIK